MLLAERKYEAIGKLYSGPTKPLSRKHFVAWVICRRHIGKRAYLTDYLECNRICLACFGKGCKACGGIVHPMRQAPALKVSVIRRTLADCYYCSDICRNTDPHADQAESLRPSEKPNDCYNCGKSICIAAALT